MADTCTVLYPSLCTLATCPLSCGYILYLPTVPGNITYAALFGVLIVFQLGLGIAYKTWVFTGCMILGLIGEIIGYVGRVMLHDNPFKFFNFLLCVSWRASSLAQAMLTTIVRSYLVPLMISPALLSAGLYLCLSRIIVVYGSRITLFSPRTVAATFMISDTIALILQGAGGSLAGAAQTWAQLDTGKTVMIAGLIFQVVSLLVFTALGINTAIRIHRTSDIERDSRFVRLRGVKRFRYFPYALGAAVTLIFIRSVYRVAELWEGFQGPIASDEVSFMILDGPMIILAVLAVTVWHPGFAFDGEWHRADWSLKSASPKRNSHTSSFSMSEAPFNSFSFYEAK